jgi:hypothetical protein
LAAGLDYELFWKLTPHEVVRLLRGRYDFIRTECDRRRSAAYELANWISFAFHDPKGMPDFEPLPLPHAPKPDKSAADIVADAKVRAWFMARSVNVVH